MAPDEEGEMAPAEEATVQRALDAPLAVGEMLVRLQRDHTRQRKGQSHPGLFLLKMAGNPAHVDGVTVVELRPSGASDERRKVRVGDAVTRINGVAVGDFGSFSAVQEYVRTQRQLVLHVKRRDVQMRARTMRREARRHLEGFLFQQPSIARALAVAPALLPHSWFDTLEIRLHSLTLLATAASGTALRGRRAGGAQEPTGADDVDALWRAGAAAAAGGGCVDAFSSVQVKMSMLVSGDCHTTEGVEPLFEPQGPVVCNMPMIRLRLAPLGDTLRVSLMQRAGLHLRSQVNKC
jgi:hypothetical protein